MGDQGVDQRVVRVARRGMDNQPGRLVEHDKVGILMQDRQIHCLTKRHRVHRGGDRDHQLIARRYPEGGLAAALAIAGHMPGLDQPLQARARQPGQGFGEHAIESLPGLGIGNRNPFHLRRSL